MSNTQGAQEYTRGHVCHGRGLPRERAGGGGRGAVPPGELEAAAACNTNQSARARRAGRALVNGTEIRGPVPFQTVRLARPLRGCSHPGALGGKLVLLGRQVSFPSGKSSQRVTRAAWDCQLCSPPAGRHPQHALL